MAESAEPNVFSLRNRRADKVIRLSRSGIEAYETDVDKALDSFRKALKEANLLQVEEDIKKKTVLICQFNIRVANICAGRATIQAIEQFSDLVPEAETHESSLVPDMWHYTGRGYMEVDNKEQALEAFKKAEKLIQKRKVHDWPLQEYNSDWILQLEEDGNDMLTILKNNIELKGKRASEGHGDVLTMCDVMYLTYKYLDTLVKVSSVRDLREAKERLHTGKFPKAEALKQESDSVKERISSKWCDMGLIFTQLHSYSEARECFKTAKDINKTVHRGTSADVNLQICQNIATTLAMEKDFKEAVDVYEASRADTNPKDIGNKDLLLHVYLSWAFCHLRLEQTDQAHSFYTRAFDTARKIGDKCGIRDALDGLIASLLTMAKSVHTLEKYKLRYGLLDCDDITPEGATKVKNLIDEERKTIKERMAKHQKGKQSASQDTGNVMTPVGSSSKDIPEKIENGESKTRSDGQKTYRGMESELPKIEKSLVTEREAPKSSVSTSKEELKTKNKDAKNKNSKRLNPSKTQQTGQNKQHIAA